MASAHVTTRSILSSFLPRLSVSTSSSTTKFATLYSRQLSLPLLPSLGFALPSAIQLNIPGLVEGIWESILRAVPKKKTSHMKTRSRQYAGKGLKDVTALNKCSACGNVKRAHLLCPYCVNELKSMFKRLPMEKQTSNVKWQNVEQKSLEGHPITVANRAAAEAAQEQRGGSKDSASRGL